jgi:hypothetical protein
VNNNDFIQEIDEIVKIAKQINTGTYDDNLVSEYLNKLNSLLRKGWDYAFYRENEIDESMLPDQYLKQRNQIIENLQIKLGQCAVKYRSAIPNSSSDKRALTEYYETFDELIRVNGGIIGLDPDSELPDELMPKEYVDFWLKGH